MEKENLIMEYIAVWGWFIISIIFLCSSLIIVSSGEKLINNIFSMVLLFSFILSFYESSRKRNKLLEINQNEQESS